MAPPKKGNAGPISKHSRAARRATAVDIDTDKSLKEVVPPKRTKERPSVLAAHQSAGVTKKQKASRRNKMSAKARKRHERGLEMAEAVVERTEKKKEKSFRKADRIQGRAKGWDDVNKEALAEGDETSDEEAAVKAGQFVEDEEMDGEDDVESKPAPAVKALDAEKKLDDDDDEIL